MRFCPFCAHELPLDASECGYCGKRLPPTSVDTKAPLPSEPTSAVAPPAAAVEAESADDHTAVPEGIEAQQTLPAQMRSLAGSAQPDEPAEPSAASPTKSEEATRSLPSFSPADLLANMGYAAGALARRARCAAAALPVRRALRREQDELEEIYRSVGEAARTAASAFGADDAWTALDDRERDRQEIEARQREIDDARRNADRRFRQVEADSAEREQACQATLDQTLGDLTEKQAKLSAAKAELAELERRIRACERNRDAKRVQAVQAGETDKRALLERGAADQAVALGTHQQQKSQLADEVAALLQPVDMLRQAAQRERSKLHEIKAKLTGARGELEARKRALATQERQLALRTRQLDKEVARDLAHLGRALEQSAEAREALPSEYAALDAQRARIAASTQRIDALLQEGRHADSRRFRQGALALATLLLLLIAIAWLLLT